MVVVLSDTWRRHVDDTFGLGEKIKVIYNPCTAEILGKHYEKQKQIVYAGAVNRRKGYADMLKAFALIASDFKDWKIVFAGNGEVEQGKSLAKELGVASQTVFLGWVNGADKDKAFKEATIFCLPSYAEGFPMGVLDACAYGLPVITTPVGGIPDIAKDGENMLLFPPGDVKALAEKMRMMISDEELRNRISEQSVLLASTTFNVGTINAQVGDLYHSLSKTKV